MKFNKLNKKLIFYFNLIISVIEKFLAIVILTAILLFIANRTISADFSRLGSNEFLLELISDMLLMLLGIELVQLLISPSVKATLELLIFVIARKMLSPGISSSDLLLNVIAFAILLLINNICIPEQLSPRPDIVSGVKKEKTNSFRIKTGDFFKKSK